MKGNVGEYGLYLFDCVHSSTIGLSSFNQTSESGVSSSCPTFKDFTSTVNVPTTYELWHCRLGHPHHEVLNKSLPICNISVPTKLKFHSCTVCSLGKAHRLPSQLSVTQYTDPLALIFFYLWGPSSTKSHSGCSY